MIKIKREGVILRPTKLAFENLSTFNPGIYQDGKTVHIVYRAQSDKYISSFGYARLNGPVKVVERWRKPFAIPKYQYEKNGIEDPRITKVGDIIYITYVAHDGRNALIAYRYGKDLFNLKCGGIISPLMSYRKAAKLFSYTQLKDKYYFMASYYEEYTGKNVRVWEKDGVLFPEKFGGKLLMMHRILPDIQLAYFSKFTKLKDQNYWHDHIQHLSKHVVIEPWHGWEARHVGGGTPPIKTKKGWLIIYHGAQPRNKGRVYHAGAALLDLKNPGKLIARLPYPLLSPQEEYEQEGHVNDVVFPTGTSQFKGRLYIYYGTSDSYIAVASVNLDQLLGELNKHRIKK